MSVCLCVCLRVTFLKLGFSHRRGILGGLDILGSTKWRFIKFLRSIDFGGHSIFGATKFWWSNILGSKICRGRYLGVIQFSGQLIVGGLILGGPNFAGVQISLWLNRF